MSNRYKRLIQLGWDMPTIKKAKVLVVGAGALGNEVLKNLALLGLGNIWLVDMDIIEEHNLTRTVLFRAEDTGKYKAEVAAERVKEIDPSINITSFVEPVQHILGLAFFREMDIVFGCVDNIQARVDMNRYCYQTNTLFIDAGLRMIDGDVKIFGPPYDVCLDCGLSQKVRQAGWERFSCLKLRSRFADEIVGPTAPTISSIMAGFQVQTGIKYLHGADIPIASRISVLGYIDDMSITKMPANKDCPTHNLYDPIPIEKVILINGSSEELTVRDLLKEVQKVRGNNEDISVELDYDLLTHFECVEHPYKVQLLKRRGTVFADEVVCPFCQAEGKEMSQSLMQEYFINRLDYLLPEAILDKTLAEVCFPKYHIIKAKSRKTDGSLQYDYFEIGGDRKLLNV